MKPSRGSLLAAVFSVVVAAGAGADAELSARAAPGPAARRSVVLFDEGHDQRFRVGSRGALDLSRLGAFFSSAGGQVDATASKITPEGLAKAEVLVVSGAFRPFAPDEIEAVLGFLDRGGRLAVLLHIAPPVADLLHRLGVSVSNGILREEGAAIAGEAIHLTVSRLATHPVNAGLASFGIFGSWALLPTASGVTALAETGPQAWVDLNRSGTFEKGDARQRFAVALVGQRGAGRFVVFGDDAAFQNQILAERVDNRRLAGNLARWLVLRQPAAALALRGSPSLVPTAR